MELKYEEIVECIDNFWVDSNTLYKVIHSLDFSNVKSNIDINNFKKDIYKILNDKYNTIIEIEKLTDEQLYIKIIYNYFDLSNTGFCNYIKKLVDKKFVGQSNYILKQYITESARIQKIKKLYEEYIKHKNTRISDKTNRLNTDTDGTSGVDYLKRYDIQDDIIGLYEAELIEQILKEYDNGVRYRDLVKKYHPDVGEYLDEEYIKIINTLKRSNIIK